MGCFATSKTDLGGMDDMLTIESAGGDKEHDQLPVVEHSLDGTCQMTSESLVCERVA